VLLLAASGCGERSEPTGPQARVYPVTVQDAADRNLVVRAPSRRVAVLFPAAGSILRALGAGSLVVGSPLTVRQTLDVAKLRRLKPDLVVAADGTDERVLSRVAAAAKARIYLAPVDSIRAVERSITGLGLLVGRPVAARGVVHRIEAKRRAVARRLAREPVVSTFVDTGFLTTVSDNTLAGDLIREAHGSNIAGPDPDPGPFDPGRLRELNPDVYLATSDAEVDLPGLRRDPDTKRLKAVRDGHFGIVDVRLLQPGPQIGAALEQIARLLHPDAFR
jgi:ABC-type Fe3+-hydroxamate transport system substrate-binding protein